MSTKTLDDWRRNRFCGHARLKAYVQRKAWVVYWHKGSDCCTSREAFDKLGLSADAVRGFHEFPFEEAA